MELARRIFYSPLCELPILTLLIIDLPFRHNEINPIILICAYIDGMGGQPTNVSDPTNEVVLSRTSLLRTISLNTIISPVTLLHLLTTYHCELQFKMPFNFLVRRNVLVFNISTEISVLLHFDRRRGRMFQEELFFILTSLALCRFYCFFFRPVSILRILWKCCLLISEYILNIVKKIKGRQKCVYY